MHLFLKVRSTSKVGHHFDSLDVVILPGIILSLHQEAGIFGGMSSI